jgi:integrase
MDVAGPYWSKIWLFFILTGLRRNEVRDLTHAQVNVAAKAIFLSDSKTGQGQFVPLCETALAIYRAVPPRIGVPWVWYNPDTGERWADLTHIFLRHARKAGLEGVSLHALRHTFASYHAKAGTSPHALRELGRWKDLRMVVRYAHLTPDQLTEAQRALDRVISVENEKSLTLKK